MTIPAAIITFYTTSRVALCADGHHPVAGVTVAGPRWVPLGTMVEIGGHRYRVMDHTARRFDGRWDIYVPTRAEAVRLGKRKMKVITK
jgi:3D (Asp-Asp-Asp) domain-containing protein